MYSLCLTSAMEYQDQANRERLEGFILDMAKGDKDALAHLYEKTKAAVYGFSLSILKNSCDAEDVLQDTYIRIYGASGGYQPSGNPMPWIFTIARNLSLMKLRDRKRIRELDDSSSRPLAWDNPTLTAEDRLVLIAAMELLSDEERQIVMLHAVTGFKHREIASLLELPLSTVLSKYRRAIAKLKRRLGESE